MATSEIEKLERRYAENPHGLTFAPLAEVHRKNGDTTRALELLRVGLELHPNYIPASIVLGRCHQDLGDLPAAEAAFNHVLRLDDENVIALKSLADINERQEKLEEAEQWLRRLVSVDRSNEEAREQLEHIETVKAQRRRRAAAAPKPAPLEEAPAAAASESGAAPEPAAAFQPAAASQQPPTSQPPAASISAAAPAREAKPVETPVPELEPVDLSEVLSEAEAELTSAPAPAKASEPLPAREPGPKAESSGDQEKAVPVPEPASPSAIPGLIAGGFEPPSKTPPRLTPLDLEIEVEQDVVLESSGAAEFSVPDAAQDMLELAAKLNASRPRSPGRRASDKTAAERLERLEAERREAERREAERIETERAEAERREAARIEAERAEAESREAARIEAERAEAERAEAERAEAERVQAERAQAERREAERREAEQIEARSREAERLETERGESARLGPEDGPAPVRIPDEPPRPARSYVASQTRGQSVAAFFRALLLARPPEAPEPQRPQQEAGALHQDGRTAAEDATVSFDEFFGSAAMGSAPAPGGESEPSKEDLDQFQSWLQNLKR